MDRKDIRVGVVIRVTNERKWKIVSADDIHIKTQCIRHDYKDCLGNVNTYDRYFFEEHCQSLIIDNEKFMNHKMRLVNAS